MTDGKYQLIDEIESLFSELKKNNKFEVKEQYVHLAGCSIWHYMLNGEEIASIGDDSPNYTFVINDDDKELCECSEEELTQLLCQLRNI